MLMVKSRVNHGAEIFKPDQALANDSPHIVAFRPCVHTAEERIHPIPTLPSECVEIPKHMLEDLLEATNHA